MAQSMFTLDNITYVAGRRYMYDGKQIEPGDVVENANGFRTVEAMIRSRHLIPVVKDHGDVPVYYQKDVKLAHLVEEKYGLSIKWPAEETDEGDETDQVDEAEDDSVEDSYEPSEHTVPEVLEYANEHPDEMQDLFDAEVAGKDRTTLTAPLAAMIDDQNQIEI